MILIDLIIGTILIIIITLILCEIFGASYIEASLIGLVFLIIAVSKLDTIRLVNTSPILSIAISAFVISVISICASIFLHNLIYR